MTSNNGIDNSLRFAGLVKRYHTWPVIREQTVAEHSFHIMRIYYQLFEMPAPVWEYIMKHDLPEIGTGDVPFHVKRKHPAVKAAMDGAEEAWTSDMGMSWPNLTDIERRRVKLCDLLEMYEYGWEEFRRGNQYAWPIVLNTYKAVTAHASLMTLEEGAAAAKFMSDLARRGPTTEKLF